MQISISSSKQDAGERAALDGAAILSRALDQQDEAYIILATGASQFDMLSTLVRQPIDWSRVTAFHLDEYIGLPITHPASFRRYLRERFEDRLPRPLKAFHFIAAEKDPLQECRRLHSLIDSVAIDLAFIGIGENGHLAFNDPPADFETEVPYIVVDLDEACRRQQLGEGWFPELEAVPTQAISMSIRQILKSRAIICTVPDVRKADAVHQAIQGPLTPDCPASILRQHSRTRMYLDRGSSSLLKRTSRGDGA